MLVSNYIWQKSTNEVLLKMFCEERPCQLWDMMCISNISCLIIWMCGSEEYFTAWCDLWGSFIKYVYRAFNFVTKELTDCVYIRGIFAIIICIPRWTKISVTTVWKIIIIIYLLTAIGLSPGGSTHDCEQETAMTQQLITQDMDWCLPQ
jgi:hypothetical protein